MNSTAEGRKLSKRFVRERALAPHVAEPWAESFLVELRLMGVNGARIGAALSEVESHCAESDGSAHQAFGDPAEYARSLQLPVDDGPSAREVLHSVAPVLVQLLGLFLLNPSFENWLRGQQGEITTGHLASAALVLLFTLAFLQFYDPMSRMAFEHPGRLSILIGFTLTANAAAGVAALKLLDEAIWRGSAGWGLVVGAATLVAGVVWAIARLRTHGAEAEEDPITSPFHNADTSPSDKATRPFGRLSGSSRLAIFPFIALVPLGTLILLGMTLVLHQMGAK